MAEYNVHLRDYIEASAKNKVGTPREPVRHTVTDYPASFKIRPCCGRRYYWWVARSAKRNLKIEKPEKNSRGLDAKPGAGAMHSTYRPGCASCIENGGLIPSMVRSLPITRLLHIQETANPRSAPGTDPPYLPLSCWSVKIIKPLPWRPHSGLLINLAFGSTTRFYQKAASEDVTDLDLSYPLGPIQKEDG